MKKKILIFTQLFVLATSFVYGQDMKRTRANDVPAIGDMSVSCEKDNILALTASAYVLQDWQREGDSPRGYNIGAVLYDAQGDTVVGVNRNSIYKESDKTQHAEVGLMQGYFHKRFCEAPHKTLKGMQIVTTLEPCMMCSGMMTFLEADTVKYIQTDPEFGKNIERLAQDWVDSLGVAHPANERCKRIKSVSLENTTYVASLLNDGYAAYKEDNPGKSMTDYLQTEKAREIYEGASSLLSEWHLVHAQNLRVLNSARKVLGMPPYEGPARISSRAARTNLEKFKMVRKSIKHDIQ